MVQNTSQTYIQTRGLGAEGKNFGMSVYKRHRKRVIALKVLVSLT